ncbi:MAG: tetratricopeptide repeat protein [Ignavibacteriae bacterium]|jgi:tetratricopeptide (TPR) repeat protein|nr:tetratricopeptide repeat protein [Ignavibacteriota bacterium]NOG99843.1 tetratricopeptide repeat protein [Ignavibacteriota bacterium]
MMNTFKDERVENRISLLFEFNVHSPIFARIASSEMDKGNLERAGEILETGLLHHPTYSTAYYLNALVLAKQGKKDEALHNLNKADEFSPNEETKNEYLKVIDEIMPGENNDSEVSGAPILEDTNESGIENIDTDFNLNDTFDDNSFGDLDDLESLASELENAKMPPINEGNIDFDKLEDNVEGEDIITETMANIYLEQGNSNEAIEVYEKLIELHPEKEPYYKIRIEEIRQSEDM